MYVNFEILEKNKLKSIHALVLQICKQNKYEDVSKQLKEFQEEVNWLLTQDYLTTIKGKKSEDVFSKIRLSKKGANVLTDIQTPGVKDEDLKIFDWLCEVYTSEDKQIGNKRKTKMYIAEFRVNSGIEKNQLAHLLRTFLEDDENMEYNMKLEYAFFKPSNVYQSKFDLEQSRLWQYYMKNKESIDTDYKRITSK